MKMVIAGVQIQDIEGTRQYIDDTVHKEPKAIFI